MICCNLIGPGISSVHYCHYIDDDALATLVTLGTCVIQVWLLLSFDFIIYTLTNIAVLQFHFLLKVCRRDACFYSPENP